MSERDYLIAKAFRAPKSKFVMHKPEATGRLAPMAWQQPAEKMTRVKQIQTNQAAADRARKVNAGVRSSESRLNIHPTGFGPRPSFL